MFVDSVQVPSKALTPDFTNNLYSEEYHTLFSGCGTHFADKGNCISYKDYKAGNTLFCFDLTPDSSINDSHWNINKSGSFRIELRFANALEQPVVLVLYAEFDNLIEVTQERDIIIDYSC